ncbi:rhodanese-like domain-containing protein [Lacticaseibacillus baoqingensis]|uniref:Rhodanese-like domain-containing protein n=1 Tax=Lacticaseibacillus baoqingensis TaxID=2486013 RepID=A0ABW4E9K1_9LACO|nr:rhodanese-like domain-containing protein [Lacticaseibacillus baoqingensis]
MENIDTATLAAKLADHPTIIDVREPDEFNSGHIPDAINIPVSELTNRHQEIPNGAYLICRSGSRSAMATEYLTAQGQHVINVTGGLLAWQQPLEVR